MIEPIPNNWPPPCIHGDGTNLCADCQADYDYDPLAYVEYGNHPDGIERWRELQAEMAAMPIQDPSAIDATIPF